MKLAELALSPEVVDQILADLPAPYGVPRVLPQVAVTEPKPEPKSEPIPIVPAEEPMAQTKPKGINWGLVVATTGTGALVGGPVGAAVGVATGLFLAVPRGNKT